ncbi:MAG: ATP-binding cassette domain-containing protein [Anaerolineales bacterium]|jgi:ABC-2 type transport system ATP-binding protein
MSEQPAIEARHLRKVFGEPPNEKVAVADLNLTVERGEVFGFLGPNGAGKTTSIKMLLNLIRPTNGEASLLGFAPKNPASRSRVGFLPEHFRFHDWLTANEFLQLHGQLYGMPTPALRRRIPELLELVGLSEHASKRLRAFSKGMLQRIGLAQALLNEPALVFLDEPTSGLDPVGRRLVRDIIRELRTRGTTVFLNSHLLSEVEITCDRVAFIKFGEVVRVSTLQQLVEGELSVTVRARGLTPEIVGGLERWSQNVRADGEHLSLTLPGEADLPAINRYLVSEGVDVYAFQPQKISLEDLFIQIVGTDGGL